MNKKILLPLGKVCPVSCKDNPKHVAVNGQSKGCGGCAIIKYKIVSRLATVCFHVLCPMSTQRLGQLLSCSSCRARKAQDSKPASSVEISNIAGAAMSHQRC